jgi:hypothetical protein
MFAARRKRRLDRLAVAAEYRLEPLGRFTRMRAYVRDVGTRERDRVDRARLEHGPEQSPAPRR